MIGVDNTEQPMDPRLVMAIEAAFRKVSLTTVEFAPVPVAWKKSNRKGSVKGPKGDTKANLRMTIARRDGASCAYCAREFVDLDDATLDHVIPNCVVGHWQPWNLVLACEPCNNLKDDQIPLALVPMLFHLLRVLEPVARARRERREVSAPKPTNGYPSKSAEKRARRQRHQFNQAMRAMGSPWVRRAIEAPVPRAALLPKPGEQR